jgi:hypothetical protein
MLEDTQSLGGNLIENLVIPEYESDQSESLSSEISENERTVLT